MTSWHERTIARAGLRIAGATLLGADWFAARRLAGLASGPHAQSTLTVQLILAAVVFCSFTIGSALLFIGHHLFDRIMVSSRWASQHHHCQRYP
jgi:hypothetical protein